jgi:opacity protein-like surface antigen
MIEPAAGREPQSHPPQLQATAVKHPLLGRRSQRRRRLFLWLVLAVAYPGVAQAQIRGFVDVGATRFAATESFEAIVGSASGPVFGGGVEVALPHGLFASLRASRFRKNGHRVFLFEGRQFDLDIDTTVTVTPLQFSAGYRFTRVGPVVPYGGAGVGWHRYKESSAFATETEDVDQGFTGYHILGGTELRLTRFVAVAAEAEWAAVPDALGNDRNGVSASFDEHDLGGFTVRLKGVVGR